MIPSSGLYSQLPTSEYASSASIKCGVSDLPPHYNIQELTAANDAAIRKAQSDLSSIQQRLSNLRELDSIYRFRESPIRKLSSKILSEIFEHIVSTRPIDIGVRRNYIWDLMQVCACWRNIVRETPKLWRAFKVGEMNIRSDSISIRLGYCLKYSGTAPLSIILSSSNLALFPFGALDSIMKHTRRFVSLSVAGNGTRLLKSLCSVTNTFEEARLSLLRKLEIKGPCSFLYLFRNATELEEVTLKSFKLTDSVSQLSWKKVKKPKLVEMEGPIFNFIRLLQSTSLLEELIWIRNREESALGYSYEEEEIAKLPFLRTLKLYQPEPSWLWSRVVYVPSLTELVIQNENNKEMNCLLYMIKRSGSSIKQLRVGCCQVNFGWRCVKELRALEELTFLDMVENMLEPLLDEKKVYAPNFRQLHISTTYVDNPEFRKIYNDSLPAIMHSRSISSLSKADKRRPRPVPLSSIKFITPIHAHSTGPDDEQYIPALRKCEELGRRLGIKFELELQDCAKIVADMKYFDMDEEDKEEAENKVSDDVIMSELIKLFRLRGLMSDDT